MSIFMKNIKIFIFYLVFIVFGFLFLFVLDYVVGQYKDINIVRKDMGRFISESKPLEIKSQTLVPQIHDQFINQQASENRFRHIETDEFGILKGPVAQIINQRDQVILFLGGSTTENNEVDSEYRFPYLTGQQLTKITNSNFVGVNAGVRGHTSQDSINLYLNHPSPYFKNASYVAIMHNINDRLVLYSRDNYKSPIDNIRYGPAKKLQQALINTFMSVINFFEETTNTGFFIVNTIRNNFFNDATIQINENIIDEENYEIPAAKLNQVKQNYLNFISLVRANNQKPILITQPLFKKSNAQNQINQLIRQLALENKVILVDLALAAQQLGQFGGGLFYDDGIHFNNLGSKFAAETIANQFLKQAQIIEKHSLPNSTNICGDIKYKNQSLHNLNANANILNGRYPTFNQKNKKILFQTNNEQGSSISTLTLNGQIDVVFESDNPELVEHPIWMDEMHVLFIQKEGWERKLFKLNIETKIIEQITLPKIKLNIAIPSFFEGNLFFAGYIDDAPPQIYKYNFSNQELIKLTKGDGEYWRPVTNGEKIYFINNSSKTYKIYSMDLDGNNVEPIEKLSDFSSESIQWDPQLSINGDYLVFAEKIKGSSFNLFALNTKTKKKEQLTKGIFNEWDPSISESEGYIFYSTESVYGDQLRVLCKP